MPKNAQPVLSVIVRRFPHEFAADIEESIGNIQKAVANQSGFTSLQNKVTRKKNDCELVTIITFDTQANLEKWEKSPVRKSFSMELDSLSKDNATNAQFGDLALLVPPSSRLSKRVTVAILIVWILILSNLLRYPLTLLLPSSFPPLWRQAVQTSIIVVLISYFLLPYTSIFLMRLVTLFSRKRRS